MKFHVNTDTKSVGQCRARKGRCPYQHFPSKEQAEERLQQEFSGHVLSSVGKGGVREESQPKEHSIKVAPGVEIDNFMGQGRNQLTRLYSYNSTSSRNEKLSVAANLVAHEIEKLKRNGDIPDDFSYEVGYMTEDSVGADSVYVSVHVDEPESKRQEYTTHKLNGEYYIIPMPDKGVKNAYRKIYQAANKYNTTSLDGKSQNFYTDIEFSYRPPKSEAEQEYEKRIDKMVEDTGKNLTEIISHGNMSESKIKEVCTIMEESLAETRDEMYEDMKLSEISGDGEFR